MEINKKRNYIERKKTMRKLLLLSAAIALTMTSVANATPRSYVTAKAGYGFTHSDVKPGKIEDSIGVYGAAIGMYAPDNLRTEFEYNFRSKAEDTTKHAKAKLEAHTLMLNGFYDFKSESRFTPYLGVGVGMAYWEAKSDREGVQLYDKDGWTYALSAMAGTSYAITTCLDAELTVKYTYMNAAEGSNNVDGMLGLRYKF